MTDSEFEQRIAALTDDQLGRLAFLAVRAGLLQPEAIQEGFRADHREADEKPQ